MDRPSGEELLRSDFARLLLERRLPKGWRIESTKRLMHFGPDEDVEIHAPDGRWALLTVEYRSAIEPRDVPRQAQTFHQYGGGPWLVVAPYVSPRTQSALRENDIGYADATGNVHLAADEPAIYIHETGATSNPWRESRPIHSLKGQAAGRVVRALCDFRPPYGIRELAARSGTPAASVSRVVSLLDREGLLSRGERGEVTGVDWPALLHRWAADYSFMRSNRVYTFLEPRGLERLLYQIDCAGQWDRQYAITGSLAAVAIAPFAPAKQAWLFADNPVQYAGELELRPTDTGVNVLIADPFDGVVFDRTAKQGDHVFVAPSQAATDLLTGPGRNPAEGEELIRWMEEHEDEWRH